MKQGIYLMAALAVVLLLGACSGGGGGGGGAVAPTSYAVSVTVTGLGTSGTVVLQNNSGDDLTIAADGVHAFATKLYSGDVYDVTLVSKPSSLACMVGNGSGYVNLANVTTVTVACDARLALAFEVDVKQLQFSWDDHSPVVSGEHYELWADTNGDGSYVTAATIPFGQPLQSAIDVAVHQFDWAHAQYRVVACSDAPCTGATAATNSVSAPAAASNTVTTAANLLQAIGYVKASNTTALDSFGQSLALSSDGATLAVGAYFEDSAATDINGNGSQTHDCVTPSNCASNAGAVYVYKKDAQGIWAQQAYIKAPNAGAGDNFGRSVALSADGSTLAVGAYLEDSNGNAPVNNGSAPPVNDLVADSGAVYVFTRSGNTWSYQAYLKPSNTAESEMFGYSVALSNSGDTVVIGAMNEGSNTTAIVQGGPGTTYSCDPTIPTVACSDSSGAVFVFDRSGGVWAEDAYIKASTASQFDQFGWVVDISGDGNTLAVGAHMESSLTGATANDCSVAATNCVVDSGAVYVYKRTDINSAWGSETVLKASTGEVALGDHFGNSVALNYSGDTLAVGAVFKNTGLNGSVANDCTDTTPVNCITAVGAVYMFKNTGTWDGGTYLSVAHQTDNEYFGESVALTRVNGAGDGDVLVVGADGEGLLNVGLDGVATDLSYQSGAAYIYTRSGGAWPAQPGTYMKAPNSGVFAGFGNDVAISGDSGTIAIAAHEEGSASTDINHSQYYSASLGINYASGAGAAYLY